MNDHQFRQLLNYLGRSWEGYRKVRKGVKKRICRHIQQLGCRSADSYLAALDQSDAARQECERLMTVSVSRFFRDKILWETLRTDILPGMIKKNPGRFNVWSAGCARGEEVYTFKIVWLGLAERMGTLPELVLWATDMCPEYLEKAKMGVYSRTSLKEVSEAIRDRYFRTREKDTSWQIIDSVKEGIRWQTQDLLSLPPDRCFHLVFLRNNLLTYYDEELKVPAFKSVVDRILDGGYLIIGSHEQIPSTPSDLVPIAGHPCVFINNRSLSQGARSTDKVNGKQ